MLRDLLLEFRGRIEKREGVIVRLAQDLRAARVYHFLEELYRLRGIALELLKRYARERKAHAKFGVPLQELQKKRGGRDIGFPGDFLEYFPIVEVALPAVIEIFRVIPHIKDTIPLHAIRLVHLKIETDRFHAVIAFIVHPL